MAKTEISQRFFPQPESHTPMRGVVVVVGVTRANGLLMFCYRGDHELQHFADGNSNGALLSGRQLLSGWMQVRGIRRRRVVDRGSIISDHVDWPDLLTAIAATEASSVWVTHGYTRQVVDYLKKKGLDAKEVETQFRSELESEFDGVHESEQNG